MKYKYIFESKKAFYFLVFVILCQITSLVIGFFNFLMTLRLYKPNINY